MTRLALVLAGLMVAAPSVSAQSVADRLDDLRLATAVRLALVADPVTRSLDVEVSARGGAVVLTSEAGGRARDVARVTQAVRGVRAVEGLGLDAGPPLDARSDVPVVETVAIDSGPEPRPEARPRTHTVRRGDTLFGIARQYDTTVEAILSLNDRRSTSIRVGERLRIR